MASFSRLFFLLLYITSKFSSAAQNILSGSTASDYNNFVYKACHNQTIMVPGSSFPVIISSLFRELFTQSQSSGSKIFETIVGNDRTSVSGLFQCRGDLTNDECRTCLNSLEGILSNDSCGESAAARIQLFGCYARYEAEGDDISRRTTSRLRVLHKTCGDPPSSLVEIGIKELREMRDYALQELKSCVTSGGRDGFCARNHESVQAMAQCDGDFGSACDCAECVGNAIVLAQNECAYSLSAQIYLENCFISYSYLSNHHHHHSDSGSSGKLVAIVVGGAAAVSLGLLFLYVLCGKKREDW